jgi:hypothetical protein
MLRIVISRNVLFRRQSYSMDLKTKTTTKGPYHQKLSGAYIRLLRISQSQDGGFTGKLKRFRLADAPPFYTASYTWGVRSYSNSTIKLDTGELPVLQGIEPFLRMITGHETFDDRDWWWIDSLCINLSDRKERETQVSIMADIYKKARKGVVWLGEKQEEGSDCTGAIDFLSHLSTLKLAFDKDERIRSHLRSPEFEREWKSVSNLLARPWWTRVWTLQEFILPREAVLTCGSDTIGRGKFKSAMYNIFLCSTGFRDMQYEVVPRDVFDAAFNRRRVHQWYAHPQTRGMSLVAIIAYLGNHSASDPRDRIYSVLGLITARDRKVVGNPEYTTTVKQQYARLVRSFWEEYTSLDIICFSHLFNRYAEPIDTGWASAVPSWTPDWRVHTEFASPVPLIASQSASEHVGNFRPLHSRRWEAAFDAPGPQLRSRANVRFHDNLKELWCNGVVLGTIDTLGALEGCDPRCRSFTCASEQPVHGILHSTQPSTATLSWELLHLLDAVARSLALDRQDKYLRFVAPQYYVTNFLLLCQACLEGDLSSVDPTFSTWFQQNRTLRFGTQTLKSLISTVQYPPASAPSHAIVPPPVLQTARTFSFPSNATANTDSDDADVFLSRFKDTVKKKSRRMMVTVEGHVGMAPCRARLGDAVVVLFGCSIPLVLRRVGTREAWQVVGEAYVHGYMNGEVNRLVRRGTRDVHRFRLV